MKLPLNYLSLLVFFFLANASFAQIGPHASNIKWKQIDTDKVRVIFPDGFDKQGLRVANLIGYMEANNKRSIGDLSQKIDIVLHNQTTVPNGFVGIAPFRSEFFGTPPQSANLLGTIDWLDALTIHEYRHALQFSNAKVGLTKLLAILQGDNGWGLASGTSIPSWFWEGDATIIETALSKGGRGRAPFFTLGERATLMNGRSYKYDKARNNSYKDFVPDHYRLGYTMLMYGREKYGNDFWKPIFDSASRYKPLLYPFSNALKRETGMNTKDWYKTAYDDIKIKWEKERANLDLSPTNKIVTKPKKTVTNYRFPFPQKDGSIICLKSSFQRTDELVLIKDGKEKVLTSIGFHVEKYLSVTERKAIWTEYEQDPRRAKKNYSNIVFYDLKTKKKTRFTTIDRYFSPSFSYSEGRIVAVKITPEQENNIVVLNGKNGSILSKIPNPDNHFIASPKWAENDTDICYIAKSNSQLAIFKYNLINKTTQQLSPWTHHTMADLNVKGKAVYFSAGFSGIDNIYKVNFDGKQQIEQLSSVPIGAFFPAYDLEQDQLVFSEFTDMGYELSSLPLQQKTRTQNIIQFEEPALQAQYSINQVSEEEPAILDNIPNEALPIKKYKGLFKGMSLHSWNFTPSLSLPTLDIQVDNFLNDFSVNIIGGYNLNEKSTVMVTSATYGKYYPLLTAFTSLTDRNAIFLTPQDSLSVQRFRQFSVGGTVSVPLTWLRGNYATSMQPYVGFAHRMLKNVSHNRREQPDGSINTMQLGFNFSNQRRQAYQNLGPRFGQSFNMLYQVTANNAADNQIRLGGSLTFPGIGPNDNLRLGFGYQRELLKNNYQFSDAFEYPRGFGGILNDAFLKLTADYQFPLLYPDWGLWGITYFKRVSLNVFFDYGRRKIDVINFVDNHNSIGAELSFDNNFWNELPVTFGVRNSYLLTRDRDKNQIEFFVRSFLLE